MLPFSVVNLNVFSFNSEYKCFINISCPSKFSCSINYGKNGYLILVFLSKKRQTDLYKMYKSACLDSTHPWLIISIKLFLALGNFLAPSTMTMPLEYNLYQPLSIVNLNAPSFHSEFKCPSFNSQFKCSINISCSSKFSCSKNYGKYRYLIWVFLSKKKADWLVQNVQVSLPWFNTSMVDHFN